MSALTRPIRENKTGRPQRIALNDCSDDRLVSHAMRHSFGEGGLMRHNLSPAAHAPSFPASLRALPSDSEPTLAGFFRPPILVMLKKHLWPDHREAVLHHAHDPELFLATLSEACTKTGCQHGERTGQQSPIV